MLDMMPFEKDRSIEVNCIKCGLRIAKIDIKCVFKIGFYICETCFLKLDKQK
jgi:hypothetical protein